MKLRKIFLSVLLLSGAVGGWSQITIGSDKEPMEGALLDLKQNTSTGKNSNSTKALIFPRVPLQRITSLKPLVNDDSFNSVQKAQYAGATVYNTTTVGLKEGLYYWEGAKWVEIGEGADISTSFWALTGNSGTSPSNNYLGTSDNQSLALRTNNTERVRITADGSVGIGTSNPAQKLHVNATSRFDSDVYLKKTDDALPTENEPHYPLVAAADGKVKRLRSEGGNEKVLNYITYTIENVQGDHLAWLDTGINSSEYTLIVTGFRFLIGGRTGTNYNYIQASFGGGSRGTTVPVEVYASINNKGIWFLTADYIGGAPSGGENGTWILNCLIINNTIIKVLNDQYFNFGGGTTGSGTKPAGL